MSERSAVSMASAAMGRGIERARRAGAGCAAALLVLAGAVLCALPAHAQQRLLVTNGAESETTHANEHYIAAQSFITGTHQHGYVLNKVSVVVEADRTTANIAEIRADASGEPGALVHSLQRERFFSVRKLLRFAPRSGATLERSTTYWVVFNANIAFSTTDRLNPVYTASNAQTTNSDDTEWSIGDTSLEKLNASNSWATVQDSVVIELQGRTVLASELNQPATGRPTITGSALDGETLSSSRSAIADPDGLPGSGGFAYQWIRVDSDGASNPVPIAGATSARYTLTRADVGKRIVLRVSFTDNAGYDEVRSSLAFPASGTVAGHTVAPGSPVLERAEVKRPYERTGGTLDAPVYGYLSELWLSYDRQVEGNPAPGRFTVTVQGQPVRVTAVHVDQHTGESLSSFHEGRVRLTLARAISHRERDIRLSYTPPANDPLRAFGTNARAARLQSRAVRNAIRPYGLGATLLDGEMTLMEGEMTVGSGTILGRSRSGFGATEGVGALTNRTFRLNDRDVRIERLSFGAGTLNVDSNLDASTDAGFFDELDLVLYVGQRAHVVRKSTGRDAENFISIRVPNPGWSAGDVVPVRLTVVRKRPDFGKPWELLHLPEDASARRRLTDNLGFGDAVTATDPHGGTMSYRLGGRDAGLFTIEADTGQIWTRAGVHYDFESQQSCVSSFERHPEGDWPETGISAGHAYCVTVRARSSATGLERTLPVIIRVGDREVRRPFNLRVSHVLLSRTALRARWTPAEGSPAANQLQWRTVGGSWSTGRQADLAGGADSHRVTGLAGDTEYEFRVRTGYTEGGETIYGAWTDVARFRTRAPSAGPELRGARVLFEGAPVNRASIVLRFDENLPSGRRSEVLRQFFDVRVNGASVALTGESFRVSDAPNELQLTLVRSSPIPAGARIEVGYLDPSAGNDGTAIQDAAGDDAPSFCLAGTVAGDNTLTPTAYSEGRDCMGRGGDRTAPRLESVEAVTGGTVARIRLNFSEDLDFARLPSRARFQVTVDNAKRFVSGVGRGVDDRQLQVSLEGAALRSSTRFTVSYRDFSGDQTNAIQDAADNDTGSFCRARDGAIDRGSPCADTFAPVLRSMRVDSNDRSVIVLEFDENISSSPNHFRVSVGGAVRSVNSIRSFLGSAHLVRLRLEGAAIGSDELVLVSHLDPSSGNDRTAVQDAAGNDVASFCAHSDGDVFYGPGCAEHVTAPVPQSVRRDPGDRSWIGLQFTLAYDRTNLPGAASFRVSAGNLARSVTAVVGPNPLYLVLQLDSAIPAGAAFKVSYLDPSSGNDRNAIQNLFGDDAPSFCAASGGTVTTGAGCPEHVGAPGLQSMRTSNARRTVLLDFDRPLDLDVLDFSGEALESLLVDAYASRFWVRQGANQRVVARVEAGSTTDHSVVALRLDRALGSGAFMVGYTDPASGDDDDALQSLFGADAQSFCATSPRTLSTGAPCTDSRAPRPLELRRNAGFFPVLVFDERLNATGPPTGAFRLRQNGVEKSLVSSFRGNTSFESDNFGGVDSQYWELESSEDIGFPFEVSYIDPSSANDANALQDRAGNDSASFCATATSATAWSIRRGSACAGHSSARQASDGALRAELLDLPETHGGAAFTFELRFTAEVSLAHASVRDEVLSVTGGTVTRARRLKAGSNRRWEMTVDPDDSESTTVALGPTTDCKADGAVCTAGGEKLAVAIHRTVPKHPPASLSVADASVEEAEGATADFAVTLSRALGAQATVDYATADGDATAGADYTATSGTLTFAAGETSKTVSVPIIDDTVEDSGETFTLTLANATGHVRIDDAQATGTIGNEEFGTGAALTAAFESVPASHTGPRAPLALRLRFSEAIAGGAAALLGALEVSAGAATAVAPVGDDAALWTVTVTPASEVDVAVTLPAATTCRGDAAVCTADRRRFAGGATARIAGPGPVTVKLLETPASHDGRSFQFKAYFTERLAATRHAMRTDVLRVTHGVVADATVVAGQDDKWRLTIQPDSHRAVTVTLAGTDSCADSGAVCSRGGLRLREGFTLRTPGPGSAPAPASAVSRALVTSSPGANGTWDTGETVRAELRFDSTVTVAGPPGAGPTLGLELDGVRRQAAYTGGSGTATLAFAYTVTGADTGAARAGLVANGLGAGGAVVVGSDGRRAASAYSAYTGPALFVADAAVREVEGAMADFDVTLRPAASVTVSVAYATADGTAVAGADYTDTSGRVSFAPGETRKAVRVPILNDAVEDDGETFTLTLSDVTGGAELADAKATATIRNDESQADPLTARFVNVPPAHGGAAFTFQVHFSEAVRLRSRAAREHLLTVTGGAVTGARRLDADSSARWEMTVAPDAAGDTVLALPATESCAVHGAVCTSDWRKLATSIRHGVPKTAPASLSVADVSVTEESDAGADFVVTLRPAAAGEVTVGYASADGTAVAGEDYTATSGTLTFAPGETSKTVSVPLIDDAVEEDDGETFTLTLADATGHARIADAQGTASIADDESPADPLTAELVDVPARHARTPFTFELRFSEEVEVSFEALRDDVLAVTGGAVTGAARLDAGSGARWEMTVEPDGAASTTIGLSPTTDCAAAGAVCTANGKKLSSTVAAVVRAPPGLSVADARVTEGAGASVDFTVSLARAASETVTVDYASADATARAGEDYTATSGTLAFAPGETGKTVSVAVIDDAHEDPEERFTLTLANPSGSGAWLDDAAATGTIVNDDATPSVKGVTLVPDASGDGRWTPGERVEARVAFSAPVQVLRGAPTLGATAGATPLTLAYASGSGGATLVFSRAVTDADGNLEQIAVTANSLALAGGALVSRTTAAAAALGHDGTAATDPYTAPAPLTAELLDLPGGHGGAPFSFELRFSEEFELSYVTLREALTVTNGSVASSSRIEPPKNARRTITVEPSGTDAVTVELPATTDCAAAGAICTEDRRKLSAAVRATVTEIAPPDTTAPALTAAAVNGAALVLRFDEALDGASAPAPGAFAVKVDGGAGAAPSGVSVAGSAVTLTLVAAVAQGQSVTVSYTAPSANPVRDAAQNAAPGLADRAVTNETPDAPALTAEFLDVPAAHGGEAFSFELRFSEELPVSFRTLRDHAFTVTGGAITRAPRIERGKDARRTIWVEPAGTDAVTVELPATTDCTAAGAVCTEDRRTLSAAVRATVAATAPVDTTAPLLGAAAVNGATLVLTYDEALDEASAPAPGAFTVKVDGGAGAAPSGVSVAGSAVTLTLAAAVAHGEAVTVSYTAPSTHPVRDAAGNEVAALADYAVTNETPDTGAPALGAATVNGAALVLRYDEALDAASTPAAGAFAVKVDGGAGAAPSGVSVAGSAVTLTLASAVTHGQSVTVSYTAPSTHPVRDAAGNEVAALAERAVTNETPDTGAPALGAAAVNGAALVLRYDEALDAASTPAAGAFTVKVDGGAGAAPSGVSVAGSAVTLTLAAAVTRGQSVTVSYTAPSTHPVRDAAGNEAAALAERAVTNETPDTTPLTAEFLDVPAAHGGEAFSFELRFSEEFALSYVTLRHHAFAVTNGAIAKTPRIEAGKDARRTIWVEPAGTDPVTVELPATTDCAATGAICTEDRRMLSVTLRATVPATEPDTAAPALGAATVNGSTLVLTYDAALDEGSTPAAGAYTVKVDGGAGASPSGVSVAGSAVTLTLAAAVAHGQSVTVSYTAPSASPVRDAQENAAAALTEHAVTNETPDTAAPALGAATVNGSTLVLSYDTALDEDSTPAAGAYTVKVDGGAGASPSGVSVGGSAVTLTLAAAVAHGQAVTVSYTAPSASPVRDAQENAAAALTEHAVTNETPDTTAPALGAATVNGSTLVLTYDEALDEDSTPAAGTYTVKVDGGTGVNPSGVSVAGSAVTLTLAAAVAHGEAVTVSYTAPSASPVRDAAENAAAGLADRAVTNETPDTTALSAAFEAVPASHSGPGTPVSVRVRFSEAIAGGAAALLGALEVTAGTATAASDGDAALWTVTVTPASEAAVTLTLASSGPCADAGAVCTSGGRALEGTAEARIAGAAPVTVGVHETPGAHDGRAFGLEARFSDALAATRAAMRTDVLGVRGGVVADAQAVAGRPGWWRVTVQPASHAQVTVALGATESCADAGAVCSADGRRLREGFTLRVAGPDEAPATRTAVTRAAVTSGPGSNGTWDAGETVTAELRLSDTVRIAGPPGAAPTLAIVLGGARREAAYTGGSATATLAFAYEVTEADAGAAGARIAANGLSPAGTVLVDSAGRGAATGFAVGPVVRAVALSADASGDRRWTPGERVEVRLTFSEAVTVAGGTPTLAVTAGGAAHTLAYASGSGSAELVFSKAVTDPEGSLERIAVTPGSLARGGARIVAHAGGAAAMLGHGGTGPSEAPDEAAKPPLTAAFLEVPQSHGGAAFTFELRLSEEPKSGFSYRTLKGDGERASVIAVANGAVEGASRIEAGKNRRWTIRIAPAGDGDVTVRLPATTDCAGVGALCTGDGRALSAAVSATVPESVAAPRAPLTVAFESAPPEEHDGTSAFTFRIAFSEALPGYSYRTLREHTLGVAQAGTGLVPEVKRVEAGKSRRWDVTVTPGGTGDITVAVGSEHPCTHAHAVCTDDDRALSNALSATVLGPPGLSVADATVHEGPGVTVDFAVTMSRASVSTVTVDYATADGTATAGADYTAASGTLTFAPGETAKTVAVPVLDDGIDEGSETFTLTLSNPEGGNAWLDDATATGTIENSDAMPRAWLARFGRTVAFQAVETIGGRFEGGGGSQVTVGGQAVALSGEAPAPGDEAAVAETLGALAGADADAGDDTVSMTGRELLLGSAFTLSSAAEAGAPAWTAWGRFASGGFDAEEDGVRLDGSVTSGFLGADVGLGRWLAGVALGVSEGEGAFAHVENGAGGTVESRLSALYPYARVALDERLDVWGLAGWGAGTLAMTARADAGREERYETDIAMRMGAVGVRGEVLSPAEPDGLTVALRSDALWVRTRSEGAQGSAGGLLAASEANVTRVRLVAEGSRALALGAGTLTPALELGLRHDGGDAETGAGVEAGASLRYAGAGFSVEGAVRALLAHEASGYEEWGASGAVRIDPGASGRGLSLTLAPVWGAPGSGTERLWGAGDARGLAPDGTFEARRRLEAELGYGLGLGRAPGVATPFAGLTLEDGGARTVRTGVRWQVTPAATLDLEAAREEGASADGAARSLRAGVRWQLAPEATFDLEATRAGALDGAAVHAVMLRGSVRW